MLGSEGCEVRCVACHGAIRCFLCCDASCAPCLRYRVPVNTSIIPIAVLISRHRQSKVCRCRQASDGLLSIRGVVHCYLLFSSRNGDPSFNICGSCFVSYSSRQDAIGELCRGACKAAEIGSTQKSLRDGVSGEFLNDS